MELTLKDCKKYAANIVSLRGSLSKDKYTITKTAEHEGAATVIIDGTLEVLVQYNNLYLVGFRAKGKDTWYSFDDKDLEFVKDNDGKYEMVGATKTKGGKKTWKPCNTISVGFASNYNTLGVFDKYSQFSAKTFNTAVTNLSTYAGKGGKCSEQDVAALIFAVSEAIRFKSVCEAIKDAIEGKKPFSPDDFKTTVLSWDSESSNLTNMDIEIRHTQ